MGHDHDHDQHARIAAVRIDGAKNTRRSFLASLVYPHIPHHSTPSSFESVLHATRDIGHYLVQSDLFQSVHALLQPSAEPGAKTGDIDIVFTTRERPRFFLKTSTEVGNNEGNASATSRIRNVFGGAETFEANVSFGTKTRRSFHATATETLRGARAVIRVRAVGAHSGQHEFGYEAVLRHIGGLKPVASLSVRRAAGTSMKSSLFHTWTRDTRDHPIFGSRGIRAHLRQELAGLGGGATFYKAEAGLHASRVLHPGLVSWLLLLSPSLSRRTNGVLHSLGSDGTASEPTLSDRFQLGGPTNMRMFRANGLGPRDAVRPDSLGGDLFWAAGASLITHLPHKPHWPVKAQAFLNAGEGAGVCSTLRSSIAAALTQPSVSAGVGLIYLFDPVRVELNFGVPLAARASDGTRRGVQVGIGLEFL
ncbi:surface antigen-domain-containing protein [Multifurca ochricompacta]|uniref:Surface antigen-domain-containing protein n=1 Tax=Multifurca ochricompacta TaxID=376703 RepID=A0AAD4M903_9AGAM|nr:surface antigen-domain-containing protein [Multifurca ochricompacta]